MGKRSNLTETLAHYTYDLDQMGNPIVVTETMQMPLDLPLGTYLESDGLVVAEAENGQVLSGTTHAWLTSTAISGYTGTAYLHALPDVDAFYPADEITGSPKVEYVVNFTTPGTYTIWARGYADNADADALNVSLNDTAVDITGFAPEAWDWASESAQLVVETSGLYTVSLLMAEDGMRVDRLLLTTDTLYLPTGDGPAETPRQSGGAASETTTITRTLVYTYDNLYRLLNADYSTHSAGSGQAGEFYDYTYDPSGNRLTQATLAGTTVYTYDNANRLIEVNGQVYTWDNNGNLLSDGVRTFSYDTANRLASVSNGGIITEFEYNGDGDRVAQTIAGLTTEYVLDPVGLAQVLVEAAGGQSKHYVPGLAQYDGSGWAYFVPDRLGSVRLLVDPNGEVSLAQSFDPFGNVLAQAGLEQSIFGYTGEQMDPTGLVFLRARYYDPGVGRFITPDTIIPDPLRSMAWNRYLYVYNQPIRYTDPSGHICPECGPDVVQGAFAEWASNNYDAAGWVLPFVFRQDWYYRQELGAMMVENQDNLAFQTGRFIGSLINVWQGVREMGVGIIGIGGGGLEMITTSGSVIGAVPGAAVVVAGAGVAVHGAGNICQGGQGAIESGGNVINAIFGRGGGRGGRPGSNVEQNKQFRAAVQEIERQLGRKLTKDEIRELHESLHYLENPGFWDIVQEGLNLFDFGG